MCGQIYTIENQKVFSFGGAYSVDRYMRTEHISWWKQEIPCNEEYDKVTKNLELHNHQVDYIVTHTAPCEIVREMGYYPGAHDAELTRFLEWIMYEVKYKEWFFGHWHRDEQIDVKHLAIWFNVEER